MRLLDNVQEASVLLRMTGRSCRLELGSDDVDGCKEIQIWVSELARIYEIRREGNSRYTELAPTPPEMAPKVKTAIVSGSSRWKWLQ